MTDKFVEANLKAAECYEKCRSYFSAAKIYEQVGNTYKTQQNWDAMVPYYEKACSYYREHGVPDTAALSYNRGAAYVYLGFFL